MLITMSAGQIKLGCHFCVADKSGKLPAPLLIGYCSMSRIQTFVAMKLNCAGFQQLTRTSVTHSLTILGNVNNYEK